MQNILCRSLMMLNNLLKTVQSMIILRGDLHIRAYVELPQL
jgi:hypothetical protein